MYLSQNWLVTLAIQYLGVNHPILCHVTAISGGKQKLTENGTIVSSHPDPLICGTIPPFSTSRNHPRAFGGLSCCFLVQAALISNLGGGEDVTKID